MKLNVKPAAEEFINNKLGENQLLFLALNDGSSKFSKLGGTCTIGANFQFVISDVTDTDYAVPVENNAGWQLFTGEPEMVYLGDGLVLNSKNAMLSLADNGGMIDGAVTVSKNDLVGVSAEEMKNLGGKIC